MKKINLLDEFMKIHQSATETDDGNRCMIAPSPDLRMKIKEEIKQLEQKQGKGLLSNKIKAQQDQRMGLNDALIYPGKMFPLGTGPDTVRMAAANRAPLSGDLNVIVVLVQFSDKAMTPAANHFDQLFFSEGVLPHGSVKEYYKDVTHGLVNIKGQVVGPYTLPQTLAQYANGASGMGSTSPNARTMAYDAAVAANPNVDFGSYDNDGDGFVDAFIVIHAGRGGEETGNTGDIWSHKWVLAGGEYTADTTKIYSYLTVPEDAKIGVCCHELGHLLFGFPDLYDTDYTSEGIGNWCLMAGGSWNGGGDNPGHPSAWCKANQGWVSVINQTTNAVVNISDVKTSHNVYRLWKDGGSGSEYFLVENRQRSGRDSDLPGDGLLVWHIDESISSNSNETHYKVALMQADGLKNMEGGTNRGDAGDPYPGSANNKTFDKASNPNSKSYAGIDTCVAVKNIAASGPVMQAELNVKCITKTVVKDVKDTRSEKPLKEVAHDKLRKDVKEKDFKEKEFKEKEKEFKEKDIKELRKEKREKEIFEKSHTEKPDTDKRQAFDKGFTEGKLADKLADGFGHSPGEPHTASEQDLLSEIYGRLARLESHVLQSAPFIDPTLRPDLDTSALSGEDLPLMKKTKSGLAKRQFDSKSTDA